MLLVAVTPAPPRLGAAGFFFPMQVFKSAIKLTSWTKAQPVGVFRKILIILRVNGQRSYP